MALEEDLKVRKEKTVSLENEKQTPKRKGPVGGGSQPVKAGTGQMRNGAQGASEPKTIKNNECALEVG